MSRTILSFAVLVAVAVASRAQEAGATHADWPHYGGTQFSWRYTALDQINTSNVKNLLPAWIFQTGDYADNLQATPIVVDGVMYLISAQLQVFALDAATGRVIWRYKYPKPPPLPANTHADRFIFNRGVAVGDGKVFFGTRDAYLVALDQKTGRELWKVAVDDARQCGCNVTAAPLIVKGKVIVGGTGGDQAHRGYLTAFYTKTGRLAWRWYVIPGPGEKGNETWKGDSWKFGGGSPWLTGSYDPDLNLVYWGTGNAASDLYDGVWDYDSSYEVILMDREIRGRMRKVLVHLNKGGLTTVLDRITGEFLGVFSVPEVRNWITGVTEDGRLVGRNEPQVGKQLTYCPGAAGVKNWNSMAYSPRTGFLYIP